LGGIVDPPHPAPPAQRGSELVEPLLDPSAGARPILWSGGDITRGGGRDGGLPRPVRSFRFGSPARGPSSSASARARMSYGAREHLQLASSLLPLDRVHGRGRGPFSRKGAAGGARARRREALRLVSLVGRREAGGGTCRGAGRPSFSTRRYLAFRWMGRIGAGLAGPSRPNSRAVSVSRNNRRFPRWLETDVCRQQASTRETRGRFSRWFLAIPAGGPIAADKPGPGRAGRRRFHPRRGRRMDEFGRSNGTGAPRPRAVIIINLVAAHGPPGFLNRRVRFEGLHSLLMAAADPPFPFRKSLGSGAAFSARR